MTEEACCRVTAKLQSERQEGGRVVPAEKTVSAKALGQKEPGMF